MAFIKLKSWFWIIFIVSIFIFYIYSLSIKRNNLSSPNYSSSIQHGVFSKAKAFQHYLLK